MRGKEGYIFVECDLGADVFARSLSEYYDMGYRIVPGTYAEKKAIRYFSCFMELKEEE